MGMQLLENPDLEALARGSYVYDDFHWYVTAHNFTTVVSDSGTVAVGDAANGVVVLTPSDGTVADNDEAYLRTTNELFLFAANKPLVFDCSIQYTEAATNAANVAVGFMNAVAADAILDNGGGPKASFSGAVIYKVDGGTVWRCRSSVGSTNIDTVSTATAGGSAYQRLTIECRPVSSTIVEIAYFLNGQQLVDANNKPIKHNLTYTSATEMHAFFGVKNGSANQQVLNVDRVYAGQLR